MSEAARIPTVSVVTATTGRTGHLRRLVPAVLADPAVRHFVVVVDGADAATLSLLESLRERDRRLVFEGIENRGQLGAVERGIELTDAEVVLLLDDDVVPMPGLAGAHARAHAGQRDLVLVGPMPVDVPPRRADIGTLLYDHDYGSYLDAVLAGTHDVLDQLWMGNVSLRRADCRRVGASSGVFTDWYHGDREFGLRLAAAGLVGRLDPTLAAVHRHRRNGRLTLRDARLRGAALCSLHRVHPSLGPFEVASLTDGLPAPVAAAVRRVGASGLGHPTSLGLLALSTVGGRLGWARGRLGAAKLARRVALVVGATGRAKALLAEDAGRDGTGAVGRLVAG